MYVCVYVCVGYCVVCCVRATKKPDDPIKKSSLYRPRCVHVLKPACVCVCACVLLLLLLLLLFGPFDRMIGGQKKREKSGDRAGLLGAGKTPTHLCVCVCVCVCVFLCNNMTVINEQGGCRRHWQAAPHHAPFVPVGLRAQPDSQPVVVVVGRLFAPGALRAHPHVVFISKFPCHCFG